MTYEMELYHHGVKGQKWGVRRYQNRDGTYTPAGRKHRGEYSSYTPSSPGAPSARRRGFDRGKAKSIAKKVAVGAAIAGGAYVLATNENARNFVLKNAVKGAEGVAKAATSPKTKEFVKKAGSKSIDTLSKSGERVGNAMVDAALLSFGTIAISRVAEKYAASEDATQAEKDKSKLLIDILSAGISSATNAAYTNPNATAGSKSAAKQETKTASAKQDSKTATTDQDASSGDNHPYRQAYNNLVKNRPDMAERMDAMLGKPAAMDGYTADHEKDYTNFHNSVSFTDKEKAQAKILRRTGYSPAQIEQYMLLNRKNDA